MRRGLLARPCGQIAMLLLAGDTLAGNDGLGEAARRQIECPANSIEILQLASL